VGSETDNYYKKVGAGRWHWYNDGQSASLEVRRKHYPFPYTCPQCSTHSHFVNNSIMV